MIELILTIALSAIGTYFAWGAYRRIRYIGILALMLSVLLNFAMKSALILGIVSASHHGPFFAIVAFLNAVGLYYLWKAAKEIEG